MEYAELARIFKALSDETRLKIVEMLSCGEMCACDILEFFQITQPTLSYHMKILTECGLVNSRKDGSWIRYSTKTEQIAAIKDIWDSLTTDNQTCICTNYKENGKCDS